MLDSAEVSVSVRAGNHGQDCDSRRARIDVSQADVRKSEGHEVLQ